MYRPDPADKVSCIHAVAERLFQLHRRFWRKPAKLRFFAQDRWRFFLTGALSDTPTYYWGQGFAAGDKDSHKQAYTAQVLDLQPMLYRRLVNNIYLGVGWTLDIQHAAQIDETDPPKIQSTAQGCSSLSNGGSVEISWDDRDFIPNPRKGQYATLRYTHFAPDVGSDTRFDEYQLHYSRYHALNDKDVLARETDGALLRVMCRGICCRCWAVTIVCAAIMKGAIAIKMLSAVSWNIAIS